MYFCAICESRLATRIVREAGVDITEAVPCEKPACSAVRMAPMPKLSPIQAIPTGRSLFRLSRPGARYAVHLDGDARPGAWLPDGEPLADGWTDVYPENEARALLPFLRVRGTAGRHGAEPTTPDGKLVARACKRLGLSAARLGETIGAHESVLSRARHGELPEVHRVAIKALLKGKPKGAS